MKLIAFERNVLSEINFSHSSVKYSFQSLWIARTGSTTVICIVLCLHQFNRTQAVLHGFICRYVTVQVNEVKNWATVFVVGALELHSFVKYRHVSQMPTHRYVCIVDTQRGNCEISRQKHSTIVNIMSSSFILCISFNMECTRISSGILPQQCGWYY